MHPSLDLGFCLGAGTGVLSWLLNRGLDEVLDLDWVEMDSKLIGFWIENVEEEEDEGGTLANS